MKDRLFALKIVRSNNSECSCKIYNKAAISAEVRKCTGRERILWGWKTWKASSHEIEMQIAKNSCRKSEKITWQVERKKYERRKKEQLLFAFTVSRSLKNCPQITLRPSTDHEKRPTFRGLCVTDHARDKNKRFINGIKWARQSGNSHACQFFP